MRYRAATHQRRLTVPRAESREITRSVVLRLLLRERDLNRCHGIRALVMEFVEGPTLAEQIAHGPIPVDEALSIAKQIAEALEAAHEQGIIHRDLKPANIKVRRDGIAKLLDFGLAKATGEAGAMSLDTSELVTIASPLVTGPGMILGTCAYMSPEQARGKAVDRRTDIWAFGCVLFEMLAGATVSDTLAAVIDPFFDRLTTDAQFEAALAVVERSRRGST